MSSLTSPFVQAAVEGPIDEAVLSRLLSHVGLAAGTVYGKRGKSFLRARIAQYNHAAQHFPWVVLVDLNQEAECAPLLRASWLPAPAPNMRFRIAVREVEAWLLADGEGIGRFLGVPSSRVPRQPETLPDPKRTIVELAAQSRRREVREDMVPRAGSRRPVGPAYVSRIIQFVLSPQSGWQPDAAAQQAASLDRCLRALKQFSQSAGC